VAQDVERLDDVGGQQSESDAGLLTDAQIGFRHFDGRLVTSLTASNIFDRKLNYQDEQFRTREDIDPVFLPARTVLLSVLVRF
jgi:hypothetical protein